MLEQAPELREFGAGLQITPNGGAVLAALGLREAATRSSIRAEAVVPMDALGGARLARFDLRGLPGEPYRFYHRGDLLGMLAEACATAGVRVRTGLRVAGAVAGGKVRCEDGSELIADLVVGADGVHSCLRPLLNGSDAPFFTSFVAWRALIAGMDAPAEARIWMAPGRHVVTYPLPGGHLNVVAVQEQSAWVQEGWHQRDEPASLQAAFADCAPVLRDILARVQSTHLWGLFRHPVAETWFGHGLAILGDAAHPTLPFQAQGANLALEDAFVLAACCNEEPALETALARYQSRRRDRAVRAIDTAAANATRYHLSGVRRLAAHAALRAADKLAPNAYLRRLDWLFGHDVTAG